MSFGEYVWEMRLVVGLGLLFGLLALGVIAVTSPPAFVAGFLGLLGTLGGMSIGYAVMDRRRP